MFEEINDQDVIGPPAITGAPYVLLQKPHLPEPAFRQAVAAVRPRLRIEERTVHAPNLAGLALDEPRRTVVMVNFGRPYGDRVAGANPYPHSESISAAMASISASVRMPFSTSRVSIDADQRS